MSNTKLPALPEPPNGSDLSWWMDWEVKYIHDYAEAAILADRERQAGEAVARVNNEGFIVETGDLNLAPGTKLYTLASLPSPQAVKAGWKLLKDTTHDERSWSEDSAHENGCYSCCCMECGRMFTGHKRRVVCKSCADAPTPKPNTATRWLNVESAMEDPLFQQARAIMGTNTWFQDNALRNVINYVLSAPSPDSKAEQAEAPSEHAVGLYDALDDLVREVKRIPDMALSDNFNIKALRHAEDALARRPALATKPPAGGVNWDSIEGMSVSVDVSTSDETAEHRYFGTVTEVMEDPGSKHGVTLLVQDAKPNFELPPAGEQKPVGFMSEQQLPVIKDQGGEGGSYVPMRKTPAGLFTLALYTAPQPEHVSVQQAWEWAGGNAGIKATPDMLREALQQLDAVCDEAAGQKPVAWAVSECWSSANPDKKVLVLASGAEEAAEHEQHHSFIRWVHLAPPPEQVAQDSARLDWLCEQYVTVRIPLRYGSKECFLGSPDDNDGESVPWDIRAAIDAARARGEGERS